MSALGAAIGLGLMGAAAPAEAAPSWNAGFPLRSSVFDHDGIADFRDRDLDNNGIVKSRDGHDYSAFGDGTTATPGEATAPNAWGRGRDNDRDGVRNRFDRDTTAMA